MDAKDVISADVEGNVTIAQPATVVISLQELETNVESAQADLNNAGAEVAHLQELLGKAQQVLETAQTNFDSQIALRDAGKAQVDTAVAAATVIDV